MNTPTITHTVYLCQISPTVSCGACCGLYNVADPTRPAIEAMLERRTHWFARVPRSVAGLDAFKARVEAAESQARPFPGFHHCPYLGLIRDGGRRVGCLLHPLAEGNEGLDWRGLSYYGGMACRIYFCPSVRKLPARWLSAIRRSMDHWYDHGLILTERRLLTAFFEILEARMGRPINPADFSEGRGTAAMLRKLAVLKCTWPFRRPAVKGICNYFFEDGDDHRALPNRAAKLRPAGPHEVIFRELESSFPSPGDRRDAKRQIEALIQPLVTQLKQE